MSTSILKSFFRREGWIAGLHKNYTQYVNMMADLVGGRVCDPTQTPEECVARQETYQYDIVVGGITMCKIPAMTTKGYFIIQGSKKVIVIQEVRLKTELFTSNASCEIFLEKAHVPTRISMVDNSVIELDTNMIHNNMRGIKSVGIFELLFHVFGFNLGHVSYLVRSYCADDADACITYVMSSMRGTGGLSFAEDKETIRFKMFGGMIDSAVVATLVTMIVACVRIHLKLALPSDRDDYVLKCLKTPGETVYKIFKQCVCKTTLGNNLGTSVENYIHTFIKRGDVSIGQKTYTKMSIQLSKRSDIDVISCVRKVMMPCDENSPNIQMRQIHASQRGFICPCETPEGKTVGITKSLACCCMISTRTDMSEWVSANCDDNISPGCMWVILDGAAVGWCKNDVCITKLKTLYPTASFTVKSSNILSIRAASGRPVRPLLKVEGHPVDRNHPDITYLDPAECAVAKITSTDYGGDWRSFSHMEIHPCTMLGLAASLIPFPEHNQSARNVFSSSMIKQAMQMDTRRDKACYTLQKPVVYTTIGREVGYDESPNGLNLVVCIMSVSGFNQEDAIIVKKSAVERGMFMSVVKNTTSVLVNDPWKTVGTDGGISILHGGTERSLTEVKPMLSSPNVVDVSESAADGGQSKVHVTVKEHRTLSLGDKLSSRHGQKGVVGILMSEEDMPFNTDGITPDIIINPHAVPSRMTVGQLIESALGKAAVIRGAFVDGTPFATRNASELRGDTEVMTLGTTGKTIETPVAMGIVYYMALMHQAADKMYARLSGSKSIMSRQPISGRSKGGGLRFGEMEYDCLIAHGASKMVTEVSESSDMVDAPYCIECHIVTDVFDGKCRLCGNQTVRKRVPFSYVVFKDMMLAANIQVQT
jgi:DNA-directed RNA polymerase beta subunit